MYIGEFKDGLKHGYGYWAETDSPTANNYRGDFLNDKKWGYGVFNWTSGNIYKGNYRNDEREGFGEMLWTDGSSYKGDWKNGIQHGYGIMQFSDGSSIKGYFKNNIYLGETLGQKIRIRRSKRTQSNLDETDIKHETINRKIIKFRIIIQEILILCIRFYFSLFYKIY